MGVFFRDRHPHLRTGLRTVVSELSAISLKSQSVTSLHRGDMIFGPLEADGDYAYVRCSGTLYKCHVDELVAYSRELGAARSTSSRLRVQDLNYRTVEEMMNRCARRLLTTHDQVQKERFPLPQEILGYMLGIRRTCVSAVASALKK